METPSQHHNEESGKLDEGRNASEQYNFPVNSHAENNASQTFRETPIEDAKQTTGVGFSEADSADWNRGASSGENGSTELVNKYNINDQAHSDSSTEDFIRTTSGFRHADDVNPDGNFNENPGGVSNAD